MRLEDWQKYIETQFLEEVEEPKEAPTRTVPPVRVEEKPLAPAILPLFTETEQAMETADNLSANETALEEPESGYDSPGSDIELPTIRASALEEPLASPSYRRPALLTAQEIAFLQSPLVLPPVFPSADDLNADIPSFDRYLPTSHPASPSETDLDETPEASSPLPEAEQVSEKETDIQSEEKDAALTEITPPAASRLSRPRARHARNVRLENTVSGLSAAELWAQVPRHVQTLLALGREEEEEETAQYSYKRTFQETRSELIARLLDPVLSLEEAARLLNVCPATVRRYTNRGILTCYRKETEQTNKPEGTGRETRQRRFRLSDILLFLETQQAALEADRQAEQSLTPEDLEPNSDEIDCAEP